MSNAPDVVPSHRPEHNLPPGPQSWVRGFTIGGKVAIERPFILAPMSGVTDSPFRRMVQWAGHGSVGLLVTEFISVEGMTRKNVKSLFRMAFDPNEEQPLSVQIFGADIDRMVNAARLVAGAGAATVDINCGCPAPKVVKRGGGAELMRQEDHLARLVESTVKAVDVPVTVKIRSGWNSDSLNAVEIAKKVVDAGTQMVTVHGRTRVQLYTGVADWGVVEAVAAAVNVPVVGSGDVSTAEEALWRLRTPGVAGVMIGRAAIMNPWIFGQIDDLVAGRPVHQPSNADRMALLERFRDLMAEKMPEHAIPGRIKQLLARMTKGFHHGALLRERAMRARTTAEMFAWIGSFFAADDAGELERWAGREPQAAEVQATAEDRDSCLTAIG